MSVTRVHEAPRVTKPYDDAQWAAIDALGRRGRRRARRRRRAAHAGRRADLRVDRRPRRRRVEHRGARAGQAPARRRAARAPRPAHGRRRAAALRPGQVVSGRAAAALVAELVLAPRRRADRRRSVDARLEAGRGRVRRRRRRGRRPTRRALAPASRRVGIDPARSRSRPTRIPGTSCDRSGALPVNVEPSDSKLDDPMERERLARVFERGLGEPVGWPADGAGSAAIAMRRRRSAAAAVAGDRLAAARAPLLPRARRLADRLPAAPRVAALGRADRLSVAAPPSPTDPRQALPRHASLLPAAGSWTIPARGASRAGARAHDGRPRPRAAQPVGATPPTAGTAAGGDYSGVPRTALCVEPRDGRAPRLHAAGSRTSRNTCSSSPPSRRAPRRRLGLPVVLEGYEPPRDPGSSASASRPTRA
jgi:uncharacterized protein (DUF2126 family)